MNSYDYKYDDYMNSNYMTGINNMMKDNNFTNTFMTPSYSLASTKEGFIKGNMFNNLYQGYKNYTPVMPKANSQREMLLNKLLEYKFAMIDLGLYLDVNPNDTSLINLYNEYLQEEKKLCMQYEKSYGPLTLDSMNLGQNNWVWDNGPWPWEVK